MAAAGVEEEPTARSAPECVDEAASAGQQDDLVDSAPSHAASPESGPETENDRPTPRQGIIPTAEAEPTAQSPLEPVDDSVSEDKGNEELSPGVTSPEAKPDTDHVQPAAVTEPKADDASTAQPDAAPLAASPAPETVPQPAIPMTAVAENARGGLDTSILDKLPVPVLIHSGDVLHYANRDFLEFTAYASVEELAERGGLGELFGDPYR
ncbi:hypothetical protein AB4144_35165, partial [Rhizobiaceae sp. 2RAB30]